MQLNRQTLCILKSKRTLIEKNVREDRFIANEFTFNSIFNNFITNNRVVFFNAVKRSYQLELHRNSARSILNAFKVASVNIHNLYKLCNVGKFA